MGEYKCVIKVRGHEFETSDRVLRELLVHARSVISRLPKKTVLEKEAGDLCQEIIYDVFES